MDPLVMDDQTNIRLLDKSAARTINAFTLCQRLAKVMLVTFFSRRQGRTGQCHSSICQHYFFS